jgi:hypothetical protein
MPEDDEERRGRPIGGGRRRWWRSRKFRRCSGGRKFRLGSVSEKKSEWSEKDSPRGRLCAVKISCRKFRFLQSEVPVRANFQV